MVEVFHSPPFDERPSRAVTHLVRQDLEILVKHRYQGTFSTVGWTDVSGVSCLRLPALIGSGTADIF